MSYSRIIILNLVALLTLSLHSQSVMLSGFRWTLPDYPSSGHHWKSLFNGETLEGWSVKCLERDLDYEFWSVENGTLLANSIKDLPKPKW